MLPEPMSGSYDCARAGEAMMIAANTTVVSSLFMLRLHSNWWMRWASAIETERLGANPSLIWCRVIPAGLSGLATTCVILLSFRNTPVGWATGAPLQIFRACKASRAVPTRSVFRVGKTAIGDATPVPPCKRFRPPYSPDAIRFPSCRSFAARYRFALHSEACCGKNTGAPACRNGRVRG